ncbi:MAG: chromosomal replication initiator protein DnaA [Desulfuromonadaceae bacterium]|nr:chromosomal replication initiator protein DnaA [Desulfuromonadaceae bacterium]
MKKEDLWKKTLIEISERITQQNYDSWIKQIEIIDLRNKTITLSVNNQFVKQWIIKNYLEIIKKSIEKIINDKVVIIIDINDTFKNKKSNKLETNEIKKNNISIEQDSNLNKDYNFESFISGNSNQFAAAASIAVANNPATIYNPLFIYGGVGLGKTHLLNAIGNKIKKNNNRTLVSYFTSEKFTNELINSIRYGKMDEFREKFRKIDVLLIDDVQFIAGKERTQEEFFHTFNSLYESHKQIVVTSDKFPKEIPGLEERLRSRFEWGLIADIQAPDIETKQAIIEAKAEKNKILLPEEVIKFLSNSVITNIRELEGYLVRLGAYASLTSKEITIDMAKDILKDIIVEYTNEITIDDIQKKTCNYFNIKISDIKSSKRTKKYVFPRQICMYLCRQLTDCSFPEIGEYFGGKDHSTVIHAIKKIENEIETNPNMKHILKNLKNLLIPQN